MLNKYLTDVGTYAKSKIYFMPFHASLSLSLYPLKLPDRNGINVINHNTVISGMLSGKL